MKYDFPSENGCFCRESARPPWPSRSSVASAPRGERCRASGHKYVHINSSQCLRAQTYPLYAGPGPSYPQPPGTTPNSVPWIQKDADTKYQSLQSIVDYQGKLAGRSIRSGIRSCVRMNLVTNAHAYVSNNKFNSSGAQLPRAGSAPRVTPTPMGPPAATRNSVDWLIEQALFKLVALPQIPTLRVVFLWMQRASNVSSVSVGEPWAGSIPAYDDQHLVGAQEKMSGFAAGSTLPQLYPTARRTSTRFWPTT